MSKQTADQIKADIKKLQDALLVVEQQEQEDSMPRVATGQWNEEGDRLFIKLSASDVNKIKRDWADDRDTLIIGQSGHRTQLCSERSVRKAYGNINTMYE